MKAIFKTNDNFEIQRIVKSEAMAQFIWELVNNAWRDFENTDYDPVPAWDKIHELLKKYSIDIESLIE
jgi:hypothetical protein